MKYFKFKYIALIMLSISVYSYEELQEYKVELIIFKYSTPNANELFDSILKIPDMEIINNYSLDSDTSEYRYSNFSNVSEYISSVINKDYIKSKSLYPSVWYRDDVKLETLKKLRTNIINDNEIDYIDSKSWIQSIPSYESSEYLAYENDIKNYGFFLNLYKKRFMHIQLKGYLSNLNYRNNNINIFIDDEKRIFNEEVHFFDNPYFGIIISVRQI